MRYSLSEARDAGRKDALAGREPELKPERAFFFGREKKTKQTNDHNAKLYEEYMAGYTEAPGIGD